MLPVGKLGKLTKLTGCVFGKLLTVTDPLTGCVTPLPSTDNLPPDKLVGNLVSKLLKVVSVAAPVGKGKLLALTGCVVGKFPIFTVPFTVWFSGKLVILILPETAWVLGKLPILTVPLTGCVVGKLLTLTTPTTAYVSGKLFTLTLPDIV